MKKIAMHKGYSYYIGKDQKGNFYNITPSNHAAPAGGYAKEYILDIKHLPDLFFSNEDLKNLKNIKKELLTDSKATFTSYGKCNEKLQQLANKYKTTTQIIFDAI